MHQKPPYISATDNVILFDGVCKLCNAWSQFILEYDKQAIFTLCSVQSSQGQAILAHFGLPTAHYETMLYVENQQCYQQSDAFFKVIAKLGYPWKVLCVFSLIPKPIRNWLYDRIALNRYALFGQYQTCRIPAEKDTHRYLHEK